MVKGRLSFDGVDDRLLRDLNDTGGIQGLPVNDNDRTVFVVAQFHDATAFGGVAYGRGTLNQTFGVTVAGPGPDEGRLAAQGWGTAHDVVTTTPLYDQSGTAGWSTLSFTHERDGFDPADNNYLHRDGVEVGRWSKNYNTKLKSTLLRNGNTEARIVLGEEIREEGSVQFDVAAVLIYDFVLDNGQRAQVESYLASAFFGGGTNQAPTAVDDQRTIAPGETLVIDVLANDFDTDGALDPTSVVVVDTPSFATGISVDPQSGAITYTHDGSLSSDAFTYTVNDLQGEGSNVATVTIDVQDSNLPPTIDFFSGTPLSGDAPLEVTWSAQVTDAEGDAMTYELLFGDGQSSGTQPVPLNGLITVSHTYSANGVYTAQLSVSDGSQSTAAKPVDVLVGQTSTLPVTSGLVSWFETDASVVTNGSEVVSWADGSSQGNDLFAFGDPQWLAAGTPSGRPAIAFDGEGDKLERRHGSQSLFGLPAADSDRTLFFVANYLSAQGVTAGAVYGKGNFNRAFGAVVDPVSGNLGIQGQHPTNDLISNTPAEGKGWVLQSTVLAANQLSHYADGTWIDGWTHQYATRVDAPASKIVLGQDIAETGFHQLEVGAFLIYDRALSEGERQLVEAYLTNKYLVDSGPNLPPIANDDAADVDVGGSVVIDVLANDTDPNGGLDPTTVSVVTPPAFAASVSVDPITGSITYVHDGSTLPDFLTYTVSDTEGLVSNEATVTFNVALTPPVASDDVKLLSIGGSVYHRYLGE